MSDERPILITGAAGALGQVLTQGLTERGYKVRASDKLAYKGALPKGVSFDLLDVADFDKVKTLAKGVKAIVHFGAIPTEQGFDDIAHANLRGTNHIFEAAKAEGARVVVASSNHTVGFTERTKRIDEDAPHRPDGYYGVSKCYGEMLGRMMFDKHGVESAHLRIGSCLPKPLNKRNLPLWLSYPDLLRLTVACLETKNLGFRAVWGISANTQAWWKSKHWDAIGYKPQDNSEIYAKDVDMADTGPVAERFQGGTFCSEGYTRKAPGPAELP
ncbi:MAG: NAD(P)-dependent oxidoreductase [Alphaproteobacteria bacterium]|nr:NAD(P)-dependent oxidoreductase [Alphaproteobacteria bacterium]MBN9498190.1 NAD(P)-dependent oxidoreductase [Alphaproteobacteria bacterium]